MASKFQIKDKNTEGKFIKIATFRKEIKKTEPHKHNSYFEIIYLSQGSGAHFIDNYRYEVSPPIIFCVRKEQVHHWDLLSLPEGFVLILKTEFVERSLDIELKSLLAALSSLSSLQVKDTVTLNQLFELLIKENSSDEIYSSAIVEGLLKALLSKILQEAKHFRNEIVVKKNTFYAFKDLLTQSGTIKNNVAYYAELLHTTPQNLNALCRKAVNQSCADVLSEFIISEAKRLLIYTDATVSEISFTLDFKDPSHFVKYFKRNTGFTPLKFRNM